MKYSASFIKSIPKSDLHLHLDGSLRIESLIEMARKTKTKLPSYTPEGLRELVFKDHYQNLGEYLEGFQYTCAALLDLENIEQAAYELAVDNQNEGVIYIEVRYAPQLLADLSKGISIKDVLLACDKGLRAAKLKYNATVDVISGDKPEFNYGIIACAMRAFDREGSSPYFNHFSQVFQYSKTKSIHAQAALELTKACVHIRDEYGVPIVGIDLAGQEEGYPAITFIEAYQYAHKHFMHKTVHAGEAYGAESIFQAITDLYADRIGHGYYLLDENKIVHPDIKDKKKYIDDLSSYMADKRTVIEVCLTSNMQTNPEIKSIKDHNFGKMLDKRFALSICTDNRLVSNTTVSHEYELILNNFDIPLKRLKDMVAYGFKKSFYFGSYVEKRSYAKRVMQYFNKVALEHNITEN